MNNIFCFSDNWEGRLVSITGYASNDKTSIGQLKTASLKIDPFEKCKNSHDEKNFYGSDEASITFLFKLGKSLPRNFETSLLCGRQISLDHGACRGDSGGPMVTEINDIFYQIAVTHGSLVECSNELPGIFVRIDSPEILSYIQNELGIVASDKYSGTYN